MEDEESTAGEGPAPSSGETRQLLIRFQARDDEAAAELLRRLSRELHAIAVQHMRQARVIDLRFFGGLSIRETAEILGVSPETVKKDARFALAWLRSQLTT